MPRTFPARRTFALVPHHMQIFQGDGITGRRLATAANVPYRTFLRARRHQMRGLTAARLAAAYSQIARVPLDEAFRRLFCVAPTPPVVAPDAPDTAPPDPPDHA